MKQQIRKDENGKRFSSLATRKHSIGTTLAVIALVLTVVALGAFVVAFLRDPIVDYDYFDAYYDGLYESRGINQEDLFAQIGEDFYAGFDRIPD